MMIVLYTEKSLLSIMLIKVFISAPRLVHTSVFISPVVLIQEFSF
jgi:hypothetical protein